MTYSYDDECEREEREEYERGRQELEEFAKRDEAAKGAFLALVLPVLLSGIGPLYFGYIGSPTHGCLFGRSFALWATY